MYNNTLSLFILTCQLPCVTAQYLLYSKMPVFLLPCPVGYALKRISELWLFALLPKWFVCTWSWKFCKCLLTLIHCEDRARKNLTRPGHGLLCQDTRLKSELEPARNTPQACHTDGLAGDKGSSSSTHHRSLSLAKCSCSACVWLFRLLVNRA